MTLVAGSYDRLFLAFSLNNLTPLFSSSSPSSSVVAAAAAGPLSAVASSDDSVRLVSLITPFTDLGPLPDHHSSSSSLVFFPSYPLPVNLLSAGADGLVRIYDASISGPRRGDFPLLKSIPAHPRARGGAADLAIHPSGRVALTVGRGDAGLAMLNLLRGRRSFFCRLPREASLIGYVGDVGEKFVLVTEETIALHSSEDAKIVHEMASKKRVLSVAPAEGGMLYSGGEDRSITCLDTSSGKVIFCIQDAHLARIKGLVAFSNRKDESSAMNAIASASSDGVIKLWDVRMVGMEGSTPIAELNTMHRLTCLASTS